MVTSPQSAAVRPKIRPPSQLRRDRIGVDGDAGIDGRRDATQAHLALLVDFGLHDGGDEAAESRLNAHAAADAGGQRLAPVGFLDHEIERRLETRRLSEHVATKGDRILARLARQLVHEAFDGEDVVVGADPAPPSGRHGGRLGAHIFDQEVGNVVGHVDGGIDGVDVDALLEGRRQPTRDDRRTGDAIFPADDLAARQAGGNRVAIDRAIDIVLDVLLAGPHDLHRPVDLFGDANGRDHHVGLEPAPEAAADQMVVHGHFLDRQAGGLGRLRLNPRHDLGAGPDLAAVGLEMNRAVQRLHRRMGEKRQLVGGVDPVARRQALGDVAGGFRDDAVLCARDAQILPDVLRTDVGVRPFVPGHDQGIEPLLRRPHVIADDRDQIVKHDHLSHARHLPGRAIVDLADLAAEYGTLRQGRELHAGKHRVDAIDDLAVRLVRRVEAFQAACRSG